MTFFIRFKTSIRKFSSLPILTMIPFIPCFKIPSPQSTVPFSVLCCIAAQGNFLPVTHTHTHTCVFSLLIQLIYFPLSFVTLRTILLSLWFRFLPLHGFISFQCILSHLPVHFFPYLGVLNPTDVSAFYFPLTNPDMQKASRLHVRLRATCLVLHR
jgi:hypothetical protein